MRRVHDDVKLLISYGIIEQDPKSVYVPYDTIHAEFTLKAEAEEVTQPLIMSSVMEQSQ